MTALDLQRLAVRAALEEAVAWQLARRRPNQPDPLWLVHAIDALGMGRPPSYDQSLTGRVRA